jgi:hypothetical protein
MYKCINCIKNKCKKSGVRRTATGATKPYIYSLIFCDLCLVAHNHANTLSLQETYPSTCQLRMKCHLPVRMSAVRTMFLMYTLYNTCPCLHVCLYVAAYLLIRARQAFLHVYGDFQTVMYTEDTKFILKNTVTHPALKLVRLTGNFYDKPSPCSLPLL